MTDESNRIERAEIGEANISTLNVGGVQWAKIEGLAALTTEIERLRDQDKTLLSAILSKDLSKEQQDANAHPKSANTHQLEPQNSQKGSSSKAAASIDALNVAQKEPERQLNAPYEGRVRSSQLIEVAPEAPKITIMAPERPIDATNGATAPHSIQTEKVTERSDGMVLNAAKTRKDRTIDLEAAPPSAPGVRQDTPPEPTKSAAFYLGDDGRVRRPDGTFANKIEVRRFKNDTASSTEPEGEADSEKKHSIPGLVVRALGVLSTLAGKGKGQAGGQVGDVAGVATGGSVFLAAKELSELAKDTREAAKERGISGVGDVGTYLKKQLGFKSGKTKEGADKEGASKGDSGAPAGRQPKLPKPVEQSKSAIASQQDKQAAIQKAASDSQLQQSEEQHDEVIKVLGELIEAVKPKGPGMLDSALDMAGDMLGRRKKGGKGRKRSRGARLSGDRSSGRSRGESKGRRQPSKSRTRPSHQSGSTAHPRKPSIPAKVNAPMGKALPAMASVATAAGRSSGAVLKGGAAMGGAAMGRMAGMGARAIPLIGQVIALGMAGYDAYDGYNDKEGQAKAFGLKGGEDATTGQKSAMAAAKVLDLGGLTSGAAGLLGSAAGAMGFDKLQEALTFDPDDMARAIYEGMTIFDRKKPKAREVTETTINNTTMAGSSTITPRGTTAATGGWSGTPLKFNGAEAESGLPSGYLAATAAVESGGDPNARNKSGATGMFQFMPDTAAGLGMTMQDALDPAKATKAMITHTKQNQAYFEKTMGRTPEGRELYLMHQQGMGGGTKLLKNPNALAADVLNSKNVNGMQAVLQNGGRADMTAQEFVDMVLAKYDKAEAYNKANPGKAIDLDAMAGTKPKYEAPAMLRGGPRPGETAPPLTPPTSAPAPASAPPSLMAPAATPPSLADSTPASAAPVKAVEPPVMLKPVSDIQAVVSKNELKAQDKKPYAPGADPNAGMLSVLKSMDKTLKDMSKKDATKTPSGAPLRAGGKPQVSGHPTMSGPMADFANDGR